MKQRQLLLTQSRTKLTLLGRRRWQSRLKPSNNVQRLDKSSKKRRWNLKRWRMKRGTRIPIKERLKKMLRRPKRLLSLNLRRPNKSIRRSVQTLRRSSRKRPRTIRLLREIKLTQKQRKLNLLPRKQRQLQQLLQEPLQRLHLLIQKSHQTLENTALNHSCKSCRGKDSHSRLFLQVQLHHHQ